jgi:hypothetical protein
VPANRYSIQVNKFGGVSFIASSSVGKFNHDTPYTDRLASQLGRPGYLQNRLGVKLRCISDLHDIMGAYENYTDAMAGVGLTALILQARGRTVLNETDGGCRKVLVENFPSYEVTSFDAGGRWQSMCDASLLDFNTFTLKRLVESPGEPLRRAIKYTRSWVVVNDCSVYYLRYGANSYKVYGEYFRERLDPSNGPSGFLEAAARFYARALPGWGVRAIRYFRESAFVLLGQGWRGEPDIEERGPEDAVLVTATKRPR